PGVPYTASTAYPEPEVTYAGSLGSPPKSIGIEDCFEDTLYNNGTKPGFAYGYLQWADTTAGNSHKVNCGTPSSTFANAPATVCANVGADVTAIADCKVCLSTKGYWLNYNLPATDISAKAGVFQGNWLNFYPPKWA